MKGMLNFFRTQIKSNICPEAKERLESEITPKLCVEHNICPACGGNLKLENDMNSAYMWSLKICTKCGGKYENKVCSNGRNRYVQR